MVVVCSTAPFGGAVSTPQSTAMQRGKRERERGGGGGRVIKSAYILPGAHWRPRHSIRSPLAPLCGAYGLLILRTDYVHVALLMVC